MKQCYSSTLRVPFLLTIGLTCLVSSASASSLSNTSAELFIDWSSSGLTWLGAYSGNGADAKYDTMTDSDYTGWDEGLMQPANASVTSAAIGTASSTSNTVTASGYALSEGSSTGETSASGTSHIRNDFTAPATGNLSEFTLSYTFTYLLNQVNGGQSGDSAGGTAHFDFSLWDDSLPVDERQINLLTSAFTESTQLVTIEGTLTISHNFIAGNTYSIEGHVYGAAHSSSPLTQETPVPEPTTMLLFGTGIAGLVAVGRRKK